MTTDAGNITADYVVNAGGMWARDIGHMAGVAVPLHACEHFYIVTEAMPDLTANLPVLRVPDECAYYKEDAGKILLGAFEPNSKPWGMNGIPEDFEFDSLPEDFDHFEPILARAVERFPMLATAGIQTFFNGPESFTPDDRYILGEAPELKNFLWRLGLIRWAFNRLVVRVWYWLNGWKPAMRRLIYGMLTFAGCNHFRPIVVICRAAFQKHLAFYMLIIFRIDNLLRRGCAPVTDTSLSGGSGGMFWRGGWLGTGELVSPEEALHAGKTAAYEYSWKRQNWFDYSAAEHLAVRQSVGLFDMSSFGKIKLVGRDAEAVLQRIAANDVAVPVGKIVYTQFLNEAGHIEADVTITRLAYDEFLVVTPAATIRRDLHWITSHIRMMPTPMPLI